MEKNVRKVRTLQVRTNQRQPEWIIADGDSAQTKVDEEAQQR